MPVSAEELKDVMSRVASTVTVVTATGGDGPIGLTVTAFVSVSADPAIVLVCIEKMATSTQPLLDAAGFTVNLMPEGTEDEALRFAARGVDRFESSKWKDPVVSVAGPVLESGLAHLECVRIDRTEVGDHWVIYGEVLATGITDQELLPLVWLGRDFTKLG
jgi:flavin reductase (DIM6/NTAB) family NADH-FMN oxidoreductase RutF